MSRNNESTLCFKRNACYLNLFYKYPPHFYNNYCNYYGNYLLQLISTEVDLFCGNSQKWEMRGVALVPTYFVVKNCIHFPTKRFLQMFMKMQQFQNIILGHSSAPLL